MENPFVETYARNLQRNKIHDDEDGEKEEEKS